MKDFAKDIGLARKGDTAAFARLYSEVYKDLYHIALYSLRDSHDACDAVSDTVMDAFCTIGKLKDEKAFRNWIMRILSAKIKRRQREYYNAPAEIEEAFQEGFNFDFVSFEVREALENLDSESRLLLSMSVLGGYTSEEIAKICETKAATVRSKLSRIKKRLGAELSRE
ncbi:MAG: sigma-70 family RNA polymerase sigma factor [Ruminococcus sp.]|nr:sigma-70 family RNA polymerase sigma factor [Ruminococcus sp.]